MDASRLLAEAEATRALGSPDSQAWSTAAASFAELTRPASVAYCRMREAEAALASHAPRSSAMLPLRAAFGIAQSLGAAGIVRDIEVLARRGRLDLGPIGESTVAGLDETATAERRLGLTRRETEVLRLLVAGRTNREIGEALFISGKTASVHVSNILAKLEVGGRIEAAAVAHRLGLDEASHPPA